MNNKYALEILNKIINISNIKINYLKELINLELKDLINTKEYNEVITKYIEITNKEKTIYKQISNNKEYLTIIDKKLTNDISKLNNNIMSYKGDKYYILVRIYKIIDSTLDTLNSDKIDLINSLITDIQIYELELSTLYYLNKTINQKTSLVTDKLIRNKYLLTYINPLIEETLIKNNFTYPTSLIKFTDYYINKLNLPIKIYNSMQEEMFIDTLIDYIEYLDNLNILDMLKLETIAEIHTRLSYIKAMTLNIPNEVILSLIHNQTYNNNLMGKIITNNLKQAIKEKEQSKILIRILK